MVVSFGGIILFLLFNWLSLQMYLIQFYIRKYAVTAGYILYELCQ